MKTIMSSIVNHPIISVAILVSLTALFSIPIPGLVIDASNEGMIISGDSEKEYYDSVKEIFGDDVLITVSITSDNIFQEKVLQSIENLSDKINDITLNINGEDVEVVTRVSSLTTVTNIIDRDGDIDTSKLIDYIPSKLEELEEIKNNALRNETFLNDIISKDGKTTTINAYIQSAPPGDITYNHEITNKVRELIGIEKKHLKEQGVDVDIFQISFPFIKVQVTDYIKNDIKKLVPICLLVLLIILWVFFRTYIAVLIPAMTAIISIVWTLGIMAFFGYKINTVTSLIPILLIVVGCTEDIHMLSEYKNQLGAGNDKLTAIRNMAVKCGLAIFLTSSTTLLGFSALTINKIVLIREFGICTSIGLVCNFVVTILFIPGFLRWTRVPTSFVSELNKNNSPLFESIIKLLCQIAIRKRAFIIIGSIIIILIAIVGTLKVKPDADYVSYFKKDSEVRVKLDMLHSRIAGAKSILIVIDTGQEDGIKDPEIMASIARLQDYLNQRFDKTVSIADYVKIMHREMNEGNMEFFKVPDSESLIAQYLLMLEGDELERVLESDYSKACIIA
ncbi:MAG: MMPL family transporter, partial [Gammaproteobacteria bacterium]|nr:MMPL family transporter [Gammaproteobacteria bacterium]